MKTILVTGHTGFIGSNMLAYLREIGEDPIGYSTTTGRDIFNTEMLDSFVEAVDLVYHFAAYAKPGESKQKPVYAIETNVKGCLNVLDACHRYSVPLIYASSCEIYGDSEVAITEEFELKPPNPYAASKAAADRICYAYHACYDMDIKIVRLFNPYGPYQQLNKIIPVFYNQAKKGEDITVYGDGKDTRDYVYIDDIVRGLWSARALQAGEAMNLATGRETTTLEIAQRIIYLMDSDSNVKFMDYPLEHGNIKNQVGSYDKARNVGWKPMFSLREGIERTIRWLENDKR
jgi:nucleoside-diphosphate-sugar epimerase